MGKVFYKDHTILNTSRLVGSGEDPAGFIPWRFSWNLPDKQTRVMHRLRFGTLYATAEHAAAEAIPEGNTAGSRFYHR